MSKPSPPCQHFRGVYRHKIGEAHGVQVCSGCGKVRDVREARWSKLKPLSEWRRDAPAYPALPNEG